MEGLNYYGGVKHLFLTPRYETDAVLCLALRHFLLTQHYRNAGVMKHRYICRDCATWDMDVPLLLHRRCNVRVIKRRRVRLNS